jgi:hypothetical protein
MTRKEMEKELARWASVESMHVARTCSAVHVANLLSDAKIFMLQLAQEIDRLNETAGNDAPSLAAIQADVARAKLAQWDAATRAREAAQEAAK